MELNNAGIGNGLRPLEITEREWRQMLATNLDGVWRVAQCAAQRTVKAGAPGYFKTEMTDAYFDNEKGQTYIRKRRADAPPRPVGRTGRPLPATGRQRRRLHDRRGDRGRRRTVCEFALACKKCGPSAPFSLSLFVWPSR